MLALAVVIAAYLLRLSLHWAFQFDLSPYLAYLPAVILEAFVLGMWPGFAATALSGVLVTFTVNTPAQWHLLTKGADIIALILTAGICIAVSILVEQFRRNHRLLIHLEHEAELRVSEERYHAIFQTSLDIVVIATLPDCKIIEVNPRFTEELGYTREETVGKTSGELGLWVNEQEHNSLIQSILDGKPYRSVQIALRKRDANALWGLASAEWLEIRGEPCVLVSVRNVTREKQAEEARHSIEARYRAAFETSPDAIIISRLSDGVYMDVNPAFTTNIGWKREEVVGISSRELDVWVDYANRDAMMEILSKGQDFRNVEIQFRRKDGSILWGNVYATIIEVEGIPCLLIQVRDMTNEKRAEEEIRNLAFYDQVTGLANRRLLVEQFRKSTALSAHTRRKRALLFLDLDNFKTINDSRGYNTGDLLLREVANRLLACVSPSDTVSRLGGDEFVIILEELHVNPELAATQAMEVAERILTQLKQPFLLNHTESHTSCSIGLTLLVDDKTDFAYAMQHTEIAMYQAKAAGRNTARFFSPGLQAAVNARAIMEEEMRAGLEQKQFVLYFQPQFEEDKLVGAEALVRWKHPRQGLLAPGEFIPLAEETRLIVPLGAWILETVCQRIAEWSRRYPSTHITVAANISSLELHRDDFVSSVLDILARTGANPNWLELELTESVLVQDMEVAIAKMNALKAHGIRFALDDFGTGYSSLTYLKRLPLAQLKIDRSFVRDLMTDPSAIPIARTVIALGKELGLCVLAEGVEFPEQRRMLEAIGCHRHQGYLFAPPLPAEGFEQILAQYSGNPALQPV